MVGHVLHRRFEGRLRTDPGARRSFYRRLLVLEWGLALLALVVWLSAPGRRRRRGRAALAAAVAGAAHLRWSSLLVLLFVVVSTRALRAGALLEAAGSRPAGRGRAGTPSRRGTPPSRCCPGRPAERRLFTVVGVTAGVCEEWLYRGLLPRRGRRARRRAAVLGAGAGRGGGLRPGARLPGRAGIVTTGVLGGVMAALYLDTGSLLLPVCCTPLIDLRFLLVPARALPAGPGPG